MNDNDTQRRIKQTRRIRLAAVLAVALNALVLAWNVAVGSVVAIVPAACIVALLVLIVMQTRLIGTMRRTQYLNWHAEQRELAVRAIRENTQRSCLHPDAKPVDLLLTGERVAWICPDCNAELPAGWTPQTTGTGGGGGGEYTAPVRSVALSPLEAEAERKRYRRTCECRAEDRSIVQVRVPESATALASYCATCGRATGTLTATGSVQLSGTAALSGTGTLSAEGRQAACDCGKCGEYARHFGYPREQVIASQGIPPAKAPERLTDGEVKDATEAAVHFAQLAKVGLEYCLSYCPICAERLDALMRASILVPEPDLGDVRGDLKRDLRDLSDLDGAGSVPTAPMTGPGGRWRPVSELPEVRQAGDETATEGIPAGPLIENMRQELEAQREVTSPEPPAGSYDFHFDSAGREWCRDADGLCWIRPVPDGPWCRQNKSGGDER
jgi:hypothetical protein